MPFANYLCQSSPSIASIVLFSITFLGCLCTILVGARGVYKAIQSYNNKGCVDSPLYISITALFVASSSTYSVHIAVTLFCTVNSLQWTIIRSVGAFLYTAGLSLLYAFYILRLKRMFDNTEFSLSIPLTIISSFGYILQFFCIFGTPYFLLSSDFAWAMRSYLLFLAQIAIESHESNKYTSSSIKLQRLLTPAIRMIICAFIATMSSNLISIHGIYRLEVTDTQILFIMHLALVTWDMCLNLFCLYLQYSFGDTLYRHYCHKIHLCVYAIFVRKMNTNVDQSQKTHTMDVEAYALQLKQPERRDTSEESTHCTVTETTGLKLSRITEERSNVSTASHLSPHIKERRSETSISQGDSAGNEHGHERVNLIVE
eukprot:463844_1